MYLKLSSIYYIMRKLETKEMIEGFKEGRYLIVDFSSSRSYEQVRIRGSILATYETELTVPDGKQVVAYTGGITEGGLIPNDHIGTDDFLIYDTPISQWIEKGYPVELGNGSLKGIPAYKGRVLGRGNILSDPSEVHVLEDGDILIAQETDPEWTEAFYKVQAVVTDTGGSISHAAIVCRELRLPCVVGTKYATAKLPNKSEIEVFGKQGIVLYEPE